MRTKGVLFLFCFIFRDQKRRKAKQGRRSAWLDLLFHIVSAPKNNKWQQSRGEEETNESVRWFIDRTTERGWVYCYSTTKERPARTIAMIKRRHNNRLVSCISILNWPSLCLCAAKVGDLGHGSAENRA